MTHPDYFRFFTPPVLAPTPRYSYVVKVAGGQTIYIASQVALDSSGNLVGQGDFYAQARQTFENLRAALAAAGADFSHLVKLNIYLVDRFHLPLVEEVRNLYIKTQVPPAGIVMVVQSLAREEFLIEIDAIAHLPA